MPTISGMSSACLRAFLSRRLSISSLRQMFEMRDHMVGLLCVADERRKTKDERCWLLATDCLLAVVATEEAFAACESDEGVLEVVVAGLGHEGGRGAEGDYLALDDDGDVVAEALSFVHVVCAE